MTPGKALLRLYDDLYWASEDESPLESLTHRLMQRLERDRDARRALTIAEARGLAIVPRQPEDVVDEEEWETAYADFERRLAKAARS